MELMTKKGYKQSEVGLIPEDWEVSTLDEITTLMTNGFVGTATTQYTESNDGVLYIQGYNVEENSFNFRGIKRVNQKFHKNHLKSCLKEGDLLTVQTGDVGLTTIVPKELEGSNCHALIISRFKHNRIYPWFYSQYFNSNQGRSRLKELEIGTTMKHLNVGDMKDWKIPLPPTLTEQKAIANALSDVDALIASLEQTLTKKKAIKQGAMQQLLTPPHKGGKRLPGFSREWERVEVKKVINVGRGGSPRPIQDFMTTYSNGVNWIKIGDTSRFSKYINSSKEKIIPEGVQFSRSVGVGDFLLSNSMSFGRPYILKIDGCIHDGWLVLQNYQDSFDREFLYYTLMSKDVFDQYLAKASGSGVLNLNKELVKVVELNRPKDLDEQKAIAQILSDMDAEITQLETKKEKYQAIKQGMMQELLTGKTRLI
jgi:type I restriction enzyme, S subunit